MQKWKNKNNNENISRPVVSHFDIVLVITAWRLVFCSVISVSLTFSIWHHFAYFFLVTNTKCSNKSTLKKIVNQVLNVFKQQIFKFYWKNTYYVYNTISIYMSKFVMRPLKMTAPVSVSRMKNMNGWSSISCGGIDIAIMVIPWNIKMKTTR